MALVPGRRLKDLRDRAQLLLGFAGAFRRSKLVALRFEDIEVGENGLKITIWKSKNQEGFGSTIAIVRGSVACPVTALKEWLEAGALAVKSCAV